MSVLVAAHTSAGKTVVAQYAIAKAIKNRQRVIYTSPIKALSNQKYRELEAEFKDVGLMTGDVTLNPTATVIVMTTEILRNMLYKGSEVTREMAWVIFDEVHYMRDKDRGVVWEETIILLPNAVKYVFLSATIPNAKQFAQWICKIKNQPCHVVSTDYRPVPLQHYLYPSGSEGIYLVVNEKSQFKEENFTKALSILDDQSNLSNIHEDKKKKSNNKKNTKENDIKKIISLVKNSNLDPAIVFAFSKKDCEQNALALAKMDFTVKEEKEQIEFIFKSAIATLAEEDQVLPQIQMMIPLLKVGVGIHHGGLLPIVKEAVELLFQEGLLKVLFSTETFSMGINMPAKTVVFTSIEKFDGETHRWLTGGEYIQMSGRAGRRGLDEKGITIMMINKKIDTDVCRNMLSGISDALFSSFKLSYNMIVNLMRIEGLSPSFIVNQSFRQFQSEDMVPEVISEIVSSRDKLHSIKLDKDLEKSALEIKHLESQIKANDKIIQSIVIQPMNLSKFLVSGRLVKVSEFGWGIFIKHYEKHIEINSKAFKNGLVEENEINKTQEIKINSSTVKKVVKANPEKQTGMLQVVPFLFQSLENISGLKVSITDNTLKEDALTQLRLTFLNIYNKFNKQGMLPMDPIKDLSIKDVRLKETIDKNTFYNKKITDMKNTLGDQYSKCISLFTDKEEIRASLNKSIDKLIKLKETVLNEELVNRKKVLKHFDFINNETVNAKGQVACLLSSGDELVLTQILYHGLFNDIEPDYLCAVLSCFLTEEREQKEEKEIKNLELKQYFERVKEVATKVAEVLEEKRLDIDKEKYIASFKSDMMEVVYAWASGKKFIEVCNLTSSYEGNIIRIIRRLDELIKQVAECAILIGNFKLKDNLDKASELIKRGIIFAASLYLSDSK